MNLLKKTKISLIFLLSIFLVACEKSEEARRLGFSNTKEMNKIHEQGWHTKERYEEDQARISGYSSLKEMKQAIRDREKKQEEIIAFEIQNKKNREIELDLQNQLKSKCDFDVPQRIYDIHFNGGRVLPENPVFSIMLFVHALSQTKGLELERDKREMKNVLKVGSVDFKNRVLPACVENINLHFVNRSLGEREVVCYQMAYVVDNEFKVYRSMEAFLCEEADVKIQKWVKENSIKNLN